MNKFIKSTFDHISQEVENYGHSVESALLDYRQAMAKATTEAAAYKDEGAYIADKKAAAKRTAQVAIQLAENAFTVAVNIEVKSLRDDLHQHLTTRPSPAFLDALRLYYDFNLCPSHAEIEALMEQNGGCSLGYRALNRTLEKTGAEYRVDAPGSTAYEADLAALEKLAHGNLMYAPDGFFHEAVEVFGGEKRLQMRDDGTTYDAGYRWDSTGIMLATSSFKEQTGDIENMSERWSRTVLPSLKHITAYRDKEDPATGETITAAQQITQDFKATATAPAIERSEQPEVEMARKMARGRVAPTPQNMGKYTV